MGWGGITRELAATAPRHLGTAGKMRRTGGDGSDVPKGEDGVGAGEQAPQPVTNAIPHGEGSGAPPASSSSAIRAFLLASLRNALAGYVGLRKECLSCDSTAEAFSGTCARLGEAVARLNGEISAARAEIPVEFSEGIASAVSACHSSVDRLQSSLERTESLLRVLEERGV